MHVFAALASYTTISGGHGDARACKTQASRTRPRSSHRASCWKNTHVLHEHIYTRSIQTKRTWCRKCKSRIRLCSKDVLMEWSRWMNVRYTPAVGNSPLFLDESPTGLGNVIINLMQSPGNLGIVPKTRQRFRPRNVVISWTSDCRVFGTIPILHQIDDNVAQALRTFQRIRQMF